MASEVFSTKGVFSPNFSNALSGGVRPRRVEILQITGRDQESRNAKFMGTSSMHNLGIEYNPSLYSSVYKGDMTVGSLDDVYRKLQGTKPEGYTGHSLSVSDLVKVDGSTYFVDEFGFKKILKK